MEQLVLFVLFAIGLSVYKRVKKVQKKAGSTFPPPGFPPHAEASPPKPRNASSPTLGAELKKLWEEIEGEIKTAAKEFAEPSGEAKKVQTPKQADPYCPQAEERPSLEMKSYERPQETEFAPLHPQKQGAPLQADRMRSRLQPEPRPLFMTAPGASRPSEAHRAREPKAKAAPRGAHIFGGTESLRRAVVMAEVLDRPVALRPRQRRGA